MMKLLIFCHSSRYNTDPVPVSGFAFHLLANGRTLLNKHTWGIDPHLARNHSDTDVEADVTQPLVLPPEAPETFDAVLMAACPLSILVADSEARRPILNLQMFRNAATYLEPGGVLLVPFPATITEGKRRVVKSPFQQTETRTQEDKDQIAQNVRKLMSPVIHMLFEVEQNNGTSPWSKFFQPHNSATCFIFTKRDEDASSSEEEEEEDDDDEQKEDQDEAVSQDDEDDDDEEAAFEFASQAEAEAEVRRLRLVIDDLERRLQ